MKSVLDLLSSVIDLIQIGSLGSKEDESIKETKNSYQWLMEELKTGKSTRVQVSREPMMVPGKIYMFKYIPKFKTELDYWDKHPIVLCLGTMNGSKEKVTVGINISWYPPSARKYLVEKIREIYQQRYKDAIRKNSLNAVNQSPVFLDLYQLKTALDQYGLSWAIRTYIPSRIISDKICVCYEDWNKAIKLDQPRVFPELQTNNSKFSLSKIYEGFKDYLTYQRNNKSKIKERRDVSRSNGRYLFDK